MKISFDLTSIIKDPKMKELETIIKHLISKQNLDSTFSIELYEHLFNKILLKFENQSITHGQTVDLVLNTIKILGNIIITSENIPQKIKDEVQLSIDDNISFFNSCFTISEFIKKR